MAYTVDYGVPSLQLNVTTAQDGKPVYFYLMIVIIIIIILLIIILIIIIIIIILFLFLMVTLLSSYISYIWINFGRVQSYREASLKIELPFNFRRSLC